MLSYHLPVSPAITLHYRDNSATSSRPPLLLLHSLSGNSYGFNALIGAGLNDYFRIIAPDMRGRGDSSRPPSGYSLEAHCADLIALLDSLGLEQVFVAGHSFGGLLGLYFAAHYADRVLGLAMIDAAIELHPLTPMLLLGMADRLGKWYPSAEAHTVSLRAMSFMTYWDDDMRHAFLADTVPMPGGAVYVKTQKLHIAQCVMAVQGVSKRSWRRWAMQVPGPALVLSASEPFLHGQHVVQADKALETAVLLPHGLHKVVSGNHITMMFGAGAQQIAAQLIERFTAMPVRLIQTNKQLPGAPENAVVPDEVYSLAY